MEALGGLLLHAAPLVPTVLVATFTAIALRTFADHVRRTRLPLALLGAQLVTLGLTWLTIRAARDEQNPHESIGSTCPVIGDGRTILLFVLALGGMALGGIACGVAIAADWPRVGRALAYAVPSAAVTYATLFIWLDAILCGFN